MARIFDKFYFQVVTVFLAVCRDAHRQKGRLCFEAWTRKRAKKPPRSRLCLLPKTTQLALQPKSVQLRSAHHTPPSLYEWITTPPHIWPETNLLNEILLTNHSNGDTGNCLTLIHQFIHSTKSPRHSQSAVASDLG